MILPIVIVRLPDDYFIRRPVRDWPSQHPAIHLALVVTKNLLGLCLLIAGVAMLVLPGQGLLTILIGLMLIDFPGKRKWERKLIQIKPVLQGVNWIRQRHGRKPLVLESSQPSSEL
ncbi:MAG: PGPGW domain-containing protein [Pirellula sp.]